MEHAHQRDGEEDQGDGAHDRGDKAEHDQARRGDETIGRVGADGLHQPLDGVGRLYRPVVAHPCGRRLHLRHRSEPTLCPVRLALAVLAALVVAVVGAAILGEYQFDGLTGVAAGLIFGIFIAEAAVAVARRGSALLAAVCAVLAVGSLGWAIRASIGPRASIPGDVPGLAWVALVLAALGAGVRARSSGRRVGGSRIEQGRTRASASADRESPSPERPPG